MHPFLKDNLIPSYSDTYIILPMTENGNRNKRRQADSHAPEYPELYLTPLSELLRRNVNLLYLNY